MRFMRILRDGVRSLLVHRQRTFFMMAGTIVGIAALIAVYAAGRGTQELVMTRVESFGPPGILVAAGGGTGVSISIEGVTTMQVEDADVIRSMVPGVLVASPYALKRDQLVTWGAAQYQSTIAGIEPSWHESYGWFAEQGEGITDEDVATMARVCVIGKTVAREMFHGENPIGQYLQIQNQRFLIKGVLETKGLHVTGRDYDAWTAIPLTTQLRRLQNWDHITNIRIKMDSADHILAAQDHIRQILHERHHITPPQEDDFTVWGTLDVARQAAGIWGTLNVLLKSLTALILLVGGIVLMNILLISVGERTNEIGLRRALGAGERDIFIQFLAESWAVTLLGTAVGELLGVGVTLVLAHGMGLNLVLSWQPFALGAVYALAVGTIFGVQPALRAARMNPVEALRAK